MPLPTKANFNSAAATHVRADNQKAQRRCIVLHHNQRCNWLGAVCLLYSPQGQKQGRASPRLGGPGKTKRTGPGRPGAIQKNKRAGPGRALLPGIRAGPRPGPVPAPGSPSQSDRDMKEELPTSQVKLLVPDPKGRYQISCCGT